MPTRFQTPPSGRRSAREIVFDQLRAEIEDGVLLPGEVLRDQRIAQRLGVSRTPVREALQMLEQLGAVETRPGRSTRVTAASPDDARAVYAPLGALQALAAELATPLATAEDVELMRAHNERLRDVLDAGPAGATEARDADTAFHQVLVRRAGNPYLTAAIRPLLLHIRRLEALYFEQLGAAARACDQHAGIIAAVVAGDAAAAAERTRRNFDVS